MKPFVVQHPDTKLYLVETPDWNAGKWTESIDLATVYLEDRDFFPKYYPSWIMIDVPEEMRTAYKARKEKEYEEMERKRVERYARFVYHRLCPHAPPDLDVEKSTTMQAFIEGYYHHKKWGG